MGMYNKINWDLVSSAAIKSSKLSDNEKLMLFNSCKKFGTYAWGITASLRDDGNVLIEIQVDSTNLPSGDATPYTATSVSTFIRDTLVKDGLLNVELAINADTGYATVVIAASTTGTSVEPSPVIQTVTTQKPTPVPTPVEVTKPAIASVPADTQSVEAKATVSTTVPNTSEFFLDVQVFLEGVQVPHNTCAVSYGVNAPPSCTIIVPASSIIRDLPETTKIHVFFKDLLPTSEGVYEWRLLFDGELASLEYSADSNGASMSISGMHSSAYMTLMQLLSLDVSSYVFDSNPNLIGNATMAMVLGQSKVNSTIIQNILKAKGYTNMADIVYQLLRSVLAGTADSAVGKFYMSKLGNVAQGWKILKRIYGVSNVASNSPIVTVAPSTNSANPNNGSDSPTGDAKTNPGGMDQIMIGQYTKGDFIAAGNLSHDGGAGYDGMNTAFLDMFMKLTNAYAAEDVAFGGKIEITSGFRTQGYNSTLEGSSPTSLHLQGKACDISNGNLNISLTRMAEIARQVGFTEVIDTYGDRIHVGLF